MNLDLSALLVPRDGWIIVAKPEESGPEAGFGSIEITFVVHLP